MPRVRYTPRSLRDLTCLYDFLAEKNLNAARRAIQTIQKALKLLSRQPELGHPVEDLPVEFREWVIAFGSSAYLLRYRYDGNEIVLLTIRHGREAGY
jgi:plasmid stabilization system protein ParE